MIFQDAYGAAQDLLDATVRLTHELEIVISSCVDHPRAWVFGYNTRQFLEERNFMASMAGNGPVIVLKDGSRAPYFGESGSPVKDQLDQL